MQRGVVWSPAVRAKRFRPPSDRPSNFCILIFTNREKVAKKQLKDKTNGFNCHIYRQSAGPIPWFRIKISRDLPCSGSRRRCISPPTQDISTQYYRKWWSRIRGYLVPVSATRPFLRQDRRRYRTKWAGRKFVGFSRRFYLEKQLKC